jgi:hypothetical protein
MNQHFFRKKIILDRISLGLVTFLIVILTQSRIAHSSDRPLPETTINPVAPVLSVDLERAIAATALEKFSFDSLRGSHKLHRTRQKSLLYRTFGGGNFRPRKPQPKGLRVKAIG